MEKTQRPVACVRCHRRRQKCEGRAAGLACFACRKSRCPEECQPISSKRTRGRDGRYTSAPEQRVLPTDVASYPSSHDNVDADDGLTAESTTEPTVNNTLVHLFHNENHHYDEQSPPAHLSNGTEDQSNPSQSAADERSANSEDTWYTNYILSHGPNRDAPKSNSTVSTPEYHYTSRRSISRTPRSQLAEANSTVSLPPRDILFNLLESYFARFHILFPIINRAFFMDAVRANTVSQTLLRAVLFVSTIHCDNEHIYRMGFPTRLSAQDFFYTQASCVWDKDKSSDRASLMLAAFHLQFWFGDIISHRDGLWWLATAIRHAQCMRYHRRCNGQPDHDASERRRIWWCLYIRDRQVALSTGGPVIIHDLECDVEPLQACDVADMAPFAARYLLLQTELTQTASQLYFDHCSPARIYLTETSSVLQTICMNIESSFGRWERKAREQGMWDEAQPLGLHLIICYHYYLINLLRRIQRHSPSNHGVKSMILPAACEIRRLVEDLLLQFKAEQFPMIVVSAILCAMSFHVADVQNQSDGDNSNHRHLIQRNVRPFLVCLRQFEHVYILARWVRNLFTRIVSKKCREKEQRIDNEQHNTTAIPTEAALRDRQLGGDASAGLLMPGSSASHVVHTTTEDMSDLSGSHLACTSSSTAHAQDLFMNASVAEPPDIAFSDWFSFLEATDYTEGFALASRNIDDVQPEMLLGICHAPSYT